METSQDVVLTRLQSIFDDLFLDEVQLTRDLSAKDVEEWDSLKHIALCCHRRIGFRDKISRR